MGTVALQENINIAAARRMLSEAFRAGGLEAPLADARLILGHVLDLDHAALAASERMSRRGDGANSGAHAPAPRA